MCTKKYVRTCSITSGAYIKGNTERCYLLYVNIFLQVQLKILGNAYIFIKTVPSNKEFLQKYGELFVDLDLHPLLTKQTLQNLQFAPYHHHPIVYSQLLYLCNQKYVSIVTEMKEMCEM